MLHVNVRSTLAARAMLASVNISVWSARKLDKAATDQTISANGASSDAGRFNKALVDKASLASVTKAASEARTLHYARTLPWLDDGARILSADLFGDYSREMRRIKAEFERAADDFRRDYQSAVDAARGRLGTMFRESDYPAASEIRAKFQFSTRILPLPDATDFRVDIADAQAAEIRDAIEQGNRDAMARAMGDVSKRIAETVGAVAEKLAAFKPSAGKGDKAEGIFRDSLIENVRELAAILPGLNLTNDDRLAEITKRVAGLCKRGPDDVTADDLRQSDALRNETAQAARAILDDVAGFIA